jgi:hypothetical protein
MFPLARGVKHLAEPVFVLLHDVETQHPDTAVDSFTNEFVAAQLPAGKPVTVKNNEVEVGGFLAAVAHRHPDSRLEGIVDRARGHAVDQRCRRVSRRIGCRRCRNLGAARENGHAYCRRKTTP